MWSTCRGPLVTPEILTYLTPLHEESKLKMGNVLKHSSFHFIYRVEIRAMYKILLETSTSTNLSSYQFVFARKIRDSLGYSTLLNFNKLGRKGVSLLNSQTTESLSPFPVPRSYFEAIQRPHRRHHPKIEEKMFDHYTKIVKIKMPKNVIYWGN